MIAISSLVALTFLFASFSAGAQTPYLQVAEPIRDKDGRLSVIVDFVSTAHETYAGKSPAVLSVLSVQGKFFHQPQVVGLVSDVERQYRFVKQSMTSWVGSSVTAFLDDKQITALLSDARVQQVSQDTYSDLSSPMPWYDFNSGVEIYSWGRAAVNGKVAGSESTRKIYVIDSGVAHHTDFSPGQVTRTNVYCGSAGGCENQIPSYWTTTPYPVVGCYGHATHVAGIIAAPVNNSGTSGVYAGAKLISLNVNTVISGAASAELCTSPFTTTQSTVGNALDYVMMQTLYDTKMAIVNISINSAGMGIASSGTPEPNWSKVRNLATPIYRYDIGRQYYAAFVAQSAGNGARPSSANDPVPIVGSDACLWNSVGAPTGYKPLSYAPYSVDDDGIMVVGAINQSANAANPFTPPSPSSVASTPPPSNYGRCVDIWAPGDAIQSLWGAIPYSAYANQTYANVVRLSGTSMAAPHVTAAAAYLADVEGLSTPASVEQRIRQLSVRFANTSDQSGLPIMVLQLP